MIKLQIERIDEILIRAEQVVRDAQAYLRHNDLRGSDASKIEEIIDKACFAIRGARNTTDIIERIGDLNKAIAFADTLVVLIRED